MTSRTGAVENSSEEYSIFRICRYSEGGTYAAYAGIFPDTLSSTGSVSSWTVSNLERRSVSPRVEMVHKGLTYSSIIRPIIICFCVACDAVRSIGCFEILVLDGHLRRARVRS